MSRTGSEALHRGVVACLVLAALALLAGFYSVVSSAVEVSAARRLEPAQTANVKFRQVGSIATAKLVLVGTSSD